MDINRFFDLLYWLNLEPAALRAHVAVFWASVFGGMILLKFFGRAIYFNYKKDLTPPEKKLLFKIECLLLTMGFSGLAWTFFAYEALPILGSRLWMIVWLIGFVFWVYAILYYALVQMPPRIKGIVEKEKFEKYLPKKGGASA